MDKPRFDKPKFVYVTYIRTTPEELWRCDWEKGKPWRLMIPDGRVADSGEVLEIEPPRRLVLSWCNEFKPELRGDGPSRLSHELEQQKDMVKLTVGSKSTVAMKSRC